MLPITGSVSKGLLGKSSNFYETEWYVLGPTIYQHVDNTFHTRIRKKDDCEQAKTINCDCKDTN